MGKLIVYLETLVLMVVVCLNTLIGKAMSLLFPQTLRKIVLKAGLKLTMTQNPKFKYEDWGPTMFSMVFVKTTFKHLFENMGDEAFKGAFAPNTRVIDFDDKEHKVLDFLKDGWAFKNNVDIKKHQTLSDRINAARILLKEEPPCPVVVDSMDNMTSAKYGAMPERLYVVLNGKIIYKGDRGPWGYNPEKVRLILQNQS